MAAKKQERDPEKVWLGESGYWIDLETRIVTHDEEQIATDRAVDASVLLRTTLVQLGEATPEGHLITGPTATWYEISKELKINPAFRFEFCTNPTKFEEFLAGAYNLEGWEAVTLTPRSGDKGRDVIAVTKRLTSMRILDQAKAFRASRPVNQNDVRALMGVLSLDHNATKAIITTTSDFAPGVVEEFQNVMPYRLETKNGDQFVEWITQQIPATLANANRPSRP